MTTEQTGEYVTIAPSPEMRAAVLHAAGLAGLTILPVIRLALPGIPAQCPHCHADVAFPLTVFGNQVQASCPACFLAVAQIAVTSAQPA